MIRLRHLLAYTKYKLRVSFADWVIDGYYGGFWAYREHIYRKDVSSLPFYLYDFYLMNYGSFIGVNTIFKAPPVLPHGLNGIHISDKAEIGQNVTILQQVTIGSNTLANHPRFGSPTIGDNVFIGAGARIIGKITIGSNCRIGANCVVVKDMPDNTTAVLGGIRFITKEKSMNNDYIGINNVK